jgi:hypothetical protein
MKNSKPPKDHSLDPIPARGVENLPATSSVHRPNGQDLLIFMYQWAFL